MWLCEDRFKGKTAHIRLPSASQKRTCLCSLIVFQTHWLTALQWLLRGIKRVQGSSIASHLPITMELMRVLQKALDLNNADHVMLWAACCVGFFGFLRTGEFTFNSTFDPEIHLSVMDLKVDCLLNPSYHKFKNRPIPFGL